MHNLKKTCDVYWKILGNTNHLKIFIPFKYYDKYKFFITNNYNNKFVLEKSEILIKLLDNDLKLFSFLNKKINNSGIFLEFKLHQSQIEEIEYLYNDQIQENDISLEKLISYKTYSFAEEFFWKAKNSSEFIELRSIILMLKSNLNHQFNSNYE